MDKSYNKERVEELYKQLSADPYKKEKYDKPGVYSISLLDEIVYVGKARNVLQRLAQHILAIQDTNPKSNKYKVLHKGWEDGNSINFSLLGSVDGDSQEEIDDKIGHLEGAMIRFYMPELNTQIPKPGDYKHYTYNKKAQYITYEELIAHIKYHNRKKNEEDVG